jgi:Mce-associated membrane protein
VNRLWGGARTAARENAEDAAATLADDPSDTTPAADTPRSTSDTDTAGSMSDAAEHQESDDGGDTPGEPDDERRTGLAAGRRGIALIALAVVLLVAGGGFLYEAHRLQSTPSAENRALTDTEATNRVAGDVDNALARIFSYTPKGTDATEESARSVLTGRAARQYEELFDRVRSDLAGQKVSLTTVAVRTGVVDLHDGTAKLLVFLDQTSRRGDAKESHAAAQLTVTARFENDRWRIADIQTR